MKILVYGEVLFDVYPDEKYIGGASFNFAAHCSNEGLDATLLTAVGYDQLGEDAIATITEHGINDSLVLKNNKNTGMVTVTLDENKIPSYDVHVDIAYDNIELNDQIISEIKSVGFDCLYFGTLIQRNSVSRNSLVRLVRSVDFDNIFCDINLRKDCYDAESVRLCLENATILKISDEEEPLLRNLGLYNTCDQSYEGIAKAISERYNNVKIVVITLGSKGSFAYDSQTKKAYYQDAVKCEVVSTVDAGDSFGAAFLSSHLLGEDVEDSLKKGAELSSFVVAHAEAVPKR